MDWSQTRQQSILSRLDYLEQFQTSRSYFCKQKCNIKQNTQTIFVLFFFFFSVRLCIITIIFCCKDVHKKRGGLLIFRGKLRKSNCQHHVLLWFSPCFLYLNFFLKPYKNNDWCSLLTVQLLFKKCTFSVAHTLITFSKSLILVMPLLQILCQSFSQGDLIIYCCSIFKFSCCLYWMLYKY